MYVNYGRKKRYFFFCFSEAKFAKSISFFYGTFYRSTAGYFSSRLNSRPGERCTRAYSRDAPTAAAVIVIVVVVVARSSSSSSSPSAGQRRTTTGRAQRGAHDVAYLSAAGRQSVRRVQPRAQHARSRWYARRTKFVRRYARVHAESGSSSEPPPAEDPRRRTAVTPSVFARRPSHTQRPARAVAGRGIATDNQWPSTQRARLPRRHRGKYVVNIFRGITGYGIRERTPISGPRTLRTRFELKQLVWLIPIFQTPHTPPLRYSSNSGQSPRTDRPIGGEGALEREKLVGFGSYSPLENHRWTRRDDASFYLVRVDGSYHVRRKRTFSGFVLFGGHRTNDRIE